MEPLNECIFQENESTSFLRVTDFVNISDTVCSRNNKVIFDDSGPWSSQKRNLNHLNSYRLAPKHIPDIYKCTFSEINMIA